MAKRVMLAVAGSGKTYYICHMVQSERKHLILAYTHENIRNIKRELIDAHGALPALTNIMTYDSFVYRYLICPYEPTILQHFKQIDFKRKGITMNDPPPQRIKRNGTSIPNPSYTVKDKFQHYVNKVGQYYCATLSELIMQVKQNRNSLIKKAAAALNLFYDQISVDEFQDFREHDYELIIALAKQSDNILLVGDYYQHSVSARNNTGKPFNNGKHDISYTDYKQLLTSYGFEVDETTLCSSRRCCHEICNYVKQKLNIQISSANERCGRILWVNQGPEEILNDDSITKLVYENANSYCFKAVNWSYSKGDTMDNICVILTGKFDGLDQEGFLCDNIPTSTINKLYVAITRTKGDLYFIKNAVFRTVKDKYCKA